MIRLAIFGAIVVALLGAFGVTYRIGQTGARAECNAAAIQAELDVAHADLREARRSAADAEKRAAALDAQSRQNTEKLDELERELIARDAANDAAPEPEPVAAPLPVDGKCPAPPRVRPHGAYRVDDADVGRLRGTAR